MLQSELFTKTRRESPKDEVSKNADLLIRAGFIYKELAGVYSYLPLGKRVLEKIINIIREEINAIGGQELFLTSLQKKEVWEKTGRWDEKNVDVWFKTMLANKTELGLGFTHEEPLTLMMKDYISSYRDLPFSVYQFQTKFRNEARAKSGIMRTREFVMKDLYSFSKDEGEHNSFYEKSKDAYKKIFERVGLGNSTFITFASGGSFSKYSHEFQTVTDAGEDIIYLDEEKGIAINKEVYTDEVISDLGLDKSKLIEKKSVEVGNIFSLGTKFSDAFELNYSSDDGNKKPVIMGSYGIGPARVMGTVVETLSDDKGIIWPREISPFDLHLITIGDSEKVLKAGKDLYQKLTSQNIDVLWDDRDARAGEKFADSDLIGISKRVVISEKTLESGKYEYKERSKDEARSVDEEELLKELLK